MIRYFFEKSAMREVSDRDFINFIISIGYRKVDGTKHFKFIPPEYFNESLGRLQEPGGPGDRDVFTITVNRSKGFVPKSELSDGIRKIKRLYEYHKNDYLNTLRNHPRVYDEDLIRKIKLNFAEEALPDRINNEILGHPKKNKIRSDNFEIQDVKVTTNEDSLSISGQPVDKIANYKNTLPLYAALIKKNEEEYRRLLEIKNNTFSKAKEISETLSKHLEALSKNLEIKIDFSNFESVKEEYNYIVKNLNEHLENKKRNEDYFKEILRKISIIEDKILPELIVKRFTSFDEASLFVNKELKKGFKLPLIDSYEMEAQLLDGLQVLEITNEMSSKIEDNSKLIELLESLNIAPSKFNIINVAGTISNMISEGSLIVDDESGVIGVGSIGKKASSLRMFKISKIYFNLKRN